VIRAAVFDLDNTLFDSTTIPLEILQPAIAAARDANVAPHAIAADRLEAAINAARRFGLLAVAERFGIPDAIRNAWCDAYRGLCVIQQLHPYPDVVPCLKALELSRFLLTSGFRRMQESKIAALGLAPFFDAVFIDVLDDGATAGKRPFLERILAWRRLAPHELLVIGDSPESEIGAGNALGAVTVQVLRPGVARSETARHHLATLAELPALITRHA
jgi:putative hydrolase of the HAD superfamily